MTLTGLWASWATIAVEHEAEAHRARERLAGLHAAGEEYDANEELHAALVAINAAAFAMQDFFCAGNTKGRLLGTKRVHLPAVSRVVKWSSPRDAPASFAGISTLFRRP
jgi:hypothetical protein